MWLRVCVIISFLTLAVSLPDFDDQYREQRHGFQFIFHDSHNLLLVIEDNACYFARVDDFGAEFLWGEHKDILEAQAADIILHPAAHRGGVSSTTLEEVRYRYNDMLADYHCLDKHIYNLHIDYLTFLDGSTR